MKDLLFRQKKEIFISKKKFVIANVNTNSAQNQIKNEKRKRERNTLSLN